jgi:hypothetical protein
MATLFERNPRCLLGKRRSGNHDPSWAIWIRLDPKSSRTGILPPPQDSPSMPKEAPYRNIPRALGRAGHSVNSSYSVRFIRVLHNSGSELQEPNPNLNLQGPNPNRPKKSVRSIRFLQNPNNIKHVQIMSS